MRKYEHVITMEQVEEANKLEGWTFFSRGTMRSFGSKIKTDLISHKGEKYFISCEDNFDKTERLYTVRRFDQDKANIHTHSEFLQFKTLGAALEWLGVEPEPMPEEIAELDEYDQPKALYLLNDLGYTLEDALEDYEDVDFYDDKTLAEVAEEFYNEGIWGEQNDFLSRYIDFEKLGADLAHDGYDETPEGVFFFRG